MTGRKAIIADLAAMMALGGEIIAVVIDMITQAPS